MKKRYLAGPLGVITVALIWNVTLHRPPLHASAEELKPYLAPAPHDPRFPIEVYTVALNGGETKTDVLAKLPVTVFPEDRVTFVIDPSFGLGSVVQVERAAPIELKDGKTLLHKRTFANTIDDFLTEINRPLVALDRADPVATSRIQPNLKVIVTRVAKVDRTVKLPEPFETTEKKDASLDRGQKVVENPGKIGERTKIFTDTREDGEVVSSALKSNVVTIKPVTKVVRVGTRIHYGRTLTGRATWYSANTHVAMNALPRGTWVEITNPATGKKIEVQVDDSGGFSSAVAVDLNPALFGQLGFSLGQGTGNVIVREVLNPAI